MITLLLILYAPKLFIINIFYNILLLLLNLNFFYYYYSQISITNNNILYKIMQELDLLNEDSKVYKLVGPTLMSVELEEAKENISKRLQFIEAEVTNVEKAIGK